MGKNKTTAYALVFAAGKVIVGLIEGDIKSPQAALNSFINAYTSVTSIALASKACQEIIKIYPKLGNVIVWLLEDFVG